MKMKRVASPRSVPIYLKYLQELKIWVIFESLVAEHPISMTEEERKKREKKTLVRNETEKTPILSSWRSSIDFCLHQ